MSSFMSIAMITTDKTDPQLIDENPGLEAIDSITDVDQFSAELLDVVDWYIDDNEHPQAYTAEGDPTLLGAQLTAKELVRRLVTILKSDEVALFSFGPTQVFVSGGPSDGDYGSEGAEAIVDGYKLPPSVLHALGLAREISADPQVNAATEAIDANARTAGYEVMGSVGVLGILLNRESLSPEPLAAITPAQIDDYYERFIGPAIDALEAELLAESDSHYPYRGTHRAPTPNTGVRADRLDELVEDVYDLPEHNHGGCNGRVLKAMYLSRGKPKTSLTVYRSMPHNATWLNPGDWISYCPDYAAQSGYHPQDRRLDLPVRTFTVRADQLWWDGNSLLEFGYSGPPIQTTRPT